ncbi:MAG: class I SAM-dependent methyltransferase [Candidatus Eremiobacteraeota bacterium]|nr:class I SAM-dependent methyltransferase [Candidatus Eremiobacteraeota bacterium]
MNKTPASTILSPEEIKRTTDAFFAESEKSVERSLDSFIALQSMVRGQRSKSDWETIARLVLQPHALSQLARRSALSNRAFSKPRGYAGDAVMIDLIYDQTLTDPSNARLSELENWQYQTLACRAVRTRRMVTAAAIDGLTANTPRIMSFACGHLREAELSRRVAEHDFSEFIAADQDPESLSYVERVFGKYGVSTRCATVGQAIREPATFGTFDLIYATGLYDYLSQDTASSLTGAFCSMLRPGGKVIVVNFAPTLSDAGWMEGVMDWWLIYRSPEEMHQLVSHQDPDLFDVETMVDGPGALVYLTVTKNRE